MANVNSLRDSLLCSIIRAQRLEHQERGAGCYAVEGVVHKLDEERSHIVKYLVGQQEINTY